MSAPIAVTGATGSTNLPFISSISNPWLVVVPVGMWAKASPGFGHSCISAEVDLLVFETAPQSLDKDVVHAAALAVHADHDLVPFQGTGEIAASELAALVGIEDFRSAIARERFLERFDAKIGVERVAEAPGEHRAAHPVHDHH